MEQGSAGVIQDGVPPPSVQTSKAKMPMPVQSTPGLKQCTRCNQQVEIIADTYPSVLTHVMAILLIVIGLPFCVFLPYCVDCFGKPVLRCRNCGNFVSEPQ